MNAIEAGCDVAGVQVQNLNAMVAKIRRKKTCSRKHTNRKETTTAYCIIRISFQTRFRFDSISNGHVESHTKYEYNRKIVVVLFLSVQ